MAPSSLQLSAAFQELDRLYAEAARLGRVTDDLRVRLRDFADEMARVVATLKHEEEFLLTTALPPRSPPPSRGAGGMRRGR